MTATAFELPTTNRHSDVAMALLSAIDVRDLERREAELAAREAEVLRREKAIDAVERIHELRGGNGSPVAVAAMVEDDSPHREEHRSRRSGMKDALRIRERDWWIKILGVTPSAQA
jgi:CelD/BcsL family acetyltransferase involved in cellulose biosynthesis